MKIVVLSGPNNGAIYIEGEFEFSHATLQRGCTIKEIAKVMGESACIFEYIYEVEVFNVEVGEEPYLADHGQFPENAKLLVGNYW